MWCIGRGRAPCRPSYRATECAGCVWPWYLLTSQSVVNNVPPPVLGFNNNVRHRGRIFHIQTEDSGVRTPRIVTHLFADGGRIIKTIRTDYSEQLERPDLASYVRQLMKKQHKAMFVLLRAGELDAALESACGPLPQPPAPAAPAVATQPLPETPASSHTAPLTPGVEAARSSVEARRAAVDALRTPGKSVTVSEVPREPAPFFSGPVPRKSRSERPTLSRPASRYNAVPTSSSQSIFGDGVISEKSLDEVILSYLADDLEGSSD